MRGILIISEEPREMASVGGALVRAGYTVETCAPHDDAILEALGTVTPEAVLFDGLSTDRSAAEIRKLLATECSLQEVIFVLITTQDRASDIDLAGIDDFLIPPYTAGELLARLRLILWRTKNISGDQVVKIGELLIDLQNYEVMLDGIPIEMTFKEYELLKFLATHTGRVFTREALLNHVWGYDYYGGTRTVDVHIRRIRSKLGTESVDLIETVRNVGYRFAG
jgi:DNA-binding response OmpR family regulator